VSGRRHIEVVGHDIAARSRGRKLIATIGIDRYQHWRPLDNAVRDATGASQLFLELGFVDVLPPLLDEQATARAMWALVTHELKELSADDSLVLFYAGHGASQKHRLGAEVIKTGYLVPVDAEDEVFTWIDLEGWLRAVALIPAKHILVILDACHSGIALDPIIKWRDTKSWRDEPLSTLKARRSRRIITSALDDQVALDSGPRHGHSLFTGCLLDGLQHDLRRAGHLVTTGSELGLYVQRRVQTCPHSRQTPDFGTFAFDDRGEMIIPLSDATPEALEQLSTDHDELARNVEVARRRRQRIGLAAFAAAGLVVSAFTTQRYLAQRQLDAAVADELQVVRHAINDARDAEAARSKLATQAFAAFDGRRTEDGEQIWREALDRADGAAQAYLTASRHAERALAKDPNRADVRDLIGDILIDRATLSDRLHDVRQRDELLGRLALYDADGSRRARWATPGRVLVHAAPGAEISLESRRGLGSGSAAVRLAPGSYVVVVATPGRVTVRAPILVERGGEIAIDAASPPLAADVPAGFVYVPAGEFLYGNASEDDRRTFFLTTPQRRRSTAAYLIGRTEVTLGDWLAYVEALPEADRAARLPAIERVTGSVVIRPDGAGRWKIELQPEQRRYVASWGQPLDYAGRARHASQDWRRLPVTGISSETAAEYAAWLDRTGRLPGARLCTEVEWERAARGADGRPYPGGAQLAPGDANFDVTHGPGMTGPDEVGSHPASTSPFGLFDMCGNAFELTVSEHGGYVLRGGSYALDRKTANLTNRSDFNVTLGDATVGFRLCAAVGSSH